MPGLLDTLSNLSPEQTQGLLAASAQMLQQSGNPRVPMSFGATLGGGLSAYQDSIAAAQKRKLEEDAARQAATLRSLQIQEAQGGMVDKERARAEADRLRQFYTGQRTGLPAASGPQVAAPPGMVGAPAMPMPAASDPYSARMTMAQNLRNQGFHAEADAQEAAALKFKPEFSQTPQTGIGADGKPFQYVLDKEGNPKRLEGILPRDKLELANLGGTEQAYNPYALTPGQTFKKTPTISDALARERLNYDKSQPRGQIIQTDTGPMLADLRSGTARPMTGAGGETLAPKMKPIPAPIHKALLENDTALRKIDQALAAVDEYPEAFGMTNVLGDTIRQRTDPKGVKGRALVADVGSLKIHDRSGAAVTAAETPRLKPFVPNVNDTPATIKEKMGLFKQEYQAIQDDINNVYSAEQGYRAPEKAATTPAPATGKAALAGAYTDAGKERRYQEWKRSQNK